MNEAAAGFGFIENKWSDKARAASLAARRAKYGSGWAKPGWSDAARAAALEVRRAKAAARAAALGGGYAGGSSSIRDHIGDMAEAAAGYDPTKSSMSDSAEFEARQAEYEKAFRDWWKGVEFTSENIAAFNAFVAAFAGAAGGGAGAYRQATGKSVQEGASQAWGRAGRYATGNEPIYDEGGILTGFAKVGRRPYSRSDNAPVRSAFGGDRRAASLNFERTAKTYDGAGKAVGSVKYSEDVAPAGSSKPFPKGGEPAVPGGTLGAEYAQYLDQLNAQRDGGLAARGLDPLGHAAPTGEAGLEFAMSMYDRLEKIEPATPEQSDAFMDALEGLKRYREFFEGDQLERADGEGILDKVREIVDGLEGGGSAAAYPERAAEEALPYVAGSPRPGSVGYDPLAEAEAAGREAFGSGEGVGRMMGEYGFDADTDTGAAFLKGWRDAKLSGAGAVKEAAPEYVAAPAKLPEPAAREAARALGVLQGVWGVGADTAARVPDALKDDYEEGLSEGKKGYDYGITPPADRAGVLRRAQKFLDGYIGEPEEDYSPDHLGDRYNIEKFGDREKWESRNADVKVGGDTPDTRGQYSPAGLMRTAMDWLGAAMVSGDKGAANGALAYMADLLATVETDKRDVAVGLRREASEDGEEGEEADTSMIEYDEDGVEDPGTETFWEDSYADPNAPMPFDRGLDVHFKRWRNRLPTAQAYRGLATGRHVLNTGWTDEARAASLAVRRAKALARRGGVDAGVDVTGDGTGSGADDTGDGSGGDYGYDPDGDPDKGSGSGSGVGSSSGGDGDDAGKTDRRRGGGGGGGGGGGRTGWAEKAKAAFRKLYKRDPETDEEIAMAELLAGVPAAERTNGNPEPDAGPETKREDGLGLDEVVKAFRDKYGRDPATDAELSEAENLARVPEGDRGNGDPAPAGGGDSWDDKADAAFEARHGRPPKTAGECAEAEELAGVPEDQRKYATAEMKKQEKEGEKSKKEWAKKAAAAAAKGERKKPRSRAQNEKARRAAAKAEQEEERERRREARNASIEEKFKKPERTALWQAQIDKAAKQSEPVGRGKPVDPTDRIVRSGSGKPLDALYYHGDGYWRDAEGNIVGKVTRSRLGDYVYVNGQWVDEKTGRPAAGKV